jgi:hypothetical protein
MGWVAMTGIEVAVGMFAAWVWRRARHAASTAGEQVDEVVDLGVERVAGLIKAKLGDDPALVKLEAEAADAAGLGEPAVTERTRRRVVDALAEAAEQDSDFASQLQDLLKGVPARYGQVQVNAPSDRATVNAPMRGDVIIHQHSGDGPGM